MREKISDATNDDVVVLLVLREEVDRNEYERNDGASKWVEVGEVVFGGKRRNGALEKVVWRVSTEREIDSVCGKPTRTICGLVVATNEPVMRRFRVRFPTTKASEGCDVFGGREPKRAGLWW